MPPAHVPIDPTNLEGLRIELAALDPERRLSPLGMMRLSISEDAHLEVKPAVADALAALGKVGRASLVILTDTTPIARNGRRLSCLVEDQLVEQFAVRTVQLDDGHDTLHADESVLDMAAGAARGADAVITIGSGTMTDIGKIAAQRNNGIPHIVLQTAASVDGFTDNVSVILKNGVKRTVPSRWPTAVLADVVTIAGAPSEMNTAGFGEAVSLFTAPADWYLSHLVGLDTTFHPASMAILKAAAAVPPSWSAGIAAGETAAIRELTGLLAIRGIVSGVSDTTACLSGVEHVISHMLDLHHGAQHLPIGLHGEQVGVSSLVAARLWRHAIESDLIGPERLKRPDFSAAEKRVKAAFGHLGADGALADECWRDCRQKYSALEANWPKLIEVLDRWKHHCIEFDRMVTPAETLRSSLQASGAPSTFAGLKRPVTPELAHWAVANCHLMRSRFNLVDLLDLLGLWTEEHISWALEHVIGERA